MREFMMVSLGVPPSKQSYPNYISCEENRMKKILQSLPQLQNLDEETQTRLAETNIPLAIAMLLTRNETSTGYEQVFINFCQPQV